MMAARDRAVGAVRALLAVVTLPPVLAHEATHAALAAPWARRIGVVIDARGLGAQAAVDWERAPPRWGRWLAGYGPLVVGVAIATGAVAYIGLTRTVPRSAWDWLVWATLGVWWYSYVWPSASDRTSEVTP